MPVHRTLNLWAKLACLAALFLLAAGGIATRAAAAGEERILAFDSDIVVNPDASMDVTETIRVLALGFEIKRGIIREFPTRYEDAEGNRVEVGFRLKEVRRNGVPERYEVSKVSNGVSIRIGDPDVYLTSGEYTYTIMYHTTRQLGFFQGYDELYWNVTGTGWSLPIDQAGAQVRLPQGVDPSTIKTIAYTGPYGSRAERYNSTVESGRVVFSTTAPLGRYEGLTIVVQWPEGKVRRPTRADRAAWWVGRRIPLLLGLLGVLFILGYYWRAWRRVGVDPPAGFITPRDTPPGELSPAALRYIAHMGVDGKGFTTALITLATKGALRIEADEKEKYTLVKLDAPGAALATEEAMLYDALFREGDRIEAKQANWQVFSAAQDALRRSLDRQYTDVYFKRNTGELIVGVIVSVFTCLVLFLLMLGLDTPLAAGAFFTTLALLLGINVLFAQLMPAYTMLGRGVLDNIEGFKLALAGGADEAGEEHPGSRVLIEQFLPYAIALEVHNQWSRRFEAALAAQRAAAGTAGTAGDGVSHAAYMPSWYSSSFGPRHGYTSFTNFTSNFTSSFNSTISSSSSAPGSSSGGGGGGSSGGGGGGGGGGGW